MRAFSPPDELAPWRAGAHDAARRVGRELEDLLLGQRGADRQRGVGQRAQLLDVLVLEPRDLLDLVVAAVAMSKVESASRRNVGRRPQRPRGGSAAARAIAPAARVVGLGEIEHRELRGDRLAAERVGGAELSSSRSRRIRREVVW